MRGIEVLGEDAVSVLCPEDDYRLDRKERHIGRHRVRGFAKPGVKNRAREAS